MRQTRSCSEDEPMGDLTFTVDAAETVAAVATAGGIVAGTPVLTLDGELPVQFLAPGDRVVTALAPAS